MSKLCDDVVQTLKEIFPETLIKREVFVAYENQKLYIDILLPKYDIIIEVHGKQHESFVEFFHDDKSTFESSKKRDRIKEDWAKQNGYTYIVLWYHELPMTKEQLSERLLNELG